MGYRKRVNQEEVLKRKVHACRVKIKRAIKKAKDFETRKIVRRLKQAKERSEENLVQQLEKELQEAREINIESIADTIDDECDDGNRTLLEDRIFKSKVVQKQLLDFSNLKEKLQRAIDTCLAGDGVAEKTLEVSLAKEKDANGCSTMTSAEKGETKGKDRDGETVHAPKEVAKKKQKSKNRMGQRARRKLARQQGKPESRPAGKMDTLKTQRFKKTVSVSKANSIDDNANLHPSWIAKKELANAVRDSLNSKPAGQKIVFTDS